MWETNEAEEGKGKKTGERRDEIAERRKRRRICVAAAGYLSFFVGKFRGGVCVL